MAIPTDIRPASFRGIGFDAREIGFTSGRRLIAHEYPQRDDPYIEDQGRATRRWRLAAFLTTNAGESHADFQSRKRQLRDAFEQGGSGLLVHPTDGNLTVRVETLDIVESNAGVGYAEFQVGFVDAGSTFTASENAASASGSFASTLRSVVATAYAVRRRARELDDITRRLLTGTIYQRADAVLSGITSFSGTDTSEFRRLVGLIRDANTTLVDDAEGFVTAWQDACDVLADEKDGRELVGLLLGTAQDPGPFLASQAALIAGGATTESGEAALANDADTDMVMVATALSAVGRLVPDATFAAYEDATTARDAIAEQFATVIEYTADADSLAALQDLQASITRHLNEEAVDLPRLRTLTLPVPVPAIALAYQLYGDPTRATEIVERNRIADAGSVFGAIQVLTA